MASDLPEDPWIGTALARYFPAQLREQFGAYIPRHPLRREIIATHVLNSMVNRVGSTFVHRLSRAAPARAGAGGARLPGQRARCSGDVRAVAAGRGARQQGARRRAVRDADRGGLAHRARDDVVPALARAWPSRWSRRSARFMPAVQALRARLEPRGGGVAAGRPPGSPRRAAPLALRVGAAPTACIAALDIAEVAEAGAARLRRGRARCTSASATRLGPRAAAPADRRAAVRQPLADAWPRPRSATTWPSCSARSRRTVLQRRRGQPRRAAGALGARQRRRRSSARSGCSRSWPTRRRADLAMLSVALRELRNLA